MKKVSDHLRDYCKNCDSFFVNGEENKRRMLNHEERRVFLLEFYADLGLLQKVGVVERCPLCPR